MYKVMLKCYHPQLQIDTSVIREDDNRDKLILEVTKLEDILRKKGYTTQLYELIKL
jgi:hypothetical protein